MIYKKDKKKIIKTDSIEIKDGEVLYCIPHYLKYPTGWKFYQLSIMTENNEKYLIDFRDIYEDEQYELFAALSNTHIITENAELLYRIVFKEYGIRLNVVFDIFIYCFLKNIPCYKMKILEKYYSDKQVKKKMNIINKGSIKSLLVYDKLKYDDKSNDNSNNNLLLIYGSVLEDSKDFLKNQKSILSKINNDRLDEIKIDFTLLKSDIVMLNVFKKMYKESNKNEKKAISKMFERKIQSSFWNLKKESEELKLWN